MGKNNYSRWARGKNESLRPRSAPGPALMFGRDMMRDMAQLQKVYAKAASLPEDATDEERAEA